MQRAKSAIRQKRWLIIFAIMYTAGMIAVSIPKSRDITEDSDYYNFYKAGLDYANKNEIYHKNTGRPFFYPPFSGFVFQPLSLLPLNTSANIFFLLNALVLLPLSIGLLIRILLKSGIDWQTTRFAVILAVIFSLKYVWNNLVMFQINMLIFVIILVGINFLVKRKPHIAGSLFSIVMLIKITPIFLAIYVFLFYFSKKVAIWMILTVTICIALTISFRGLERGLQDHATYYDHFLKSYIIEGAIWGSPSNHSLKAAALKIFHPETIEASIKPDDYRGIINIVNIFLACSLIILCINSWLLRKRKQDFSLSNLAAIILFSHLCAGITWTAHLVTFLYILLPLLLIDYKSLKGIRKYVFFSVLFLLLFLGIEGSDTVGAKIYTFIRMYDIFTLLMLSLFLFYSYIIWDRRSAKIFPINHSI